jgi:hypothetical protein
MVLWGWETKPVKKLGSGCTSPAAHFGTAGFYPISNFAGSAFYQSVSKIRFVPSLSYLVSSSSFKGKMQEFLTQNEGFQITVKVFVCLQRQALKSLTLPSPALLPLSS